jgi:hypothetical protein
MVAEITRVVASAVDQCGLSPPQELHAHQIDTGRAKDDAAVMDNHALAVEYRKLEPGVVRPVA